MTTAQCFDWLNSLEESEVVMVENRFFFKRGNGSTTTHASLTGLFGDVAPEWEDCFSDSRITAVELAGILVSEATVC